MFLILPRLWLAAWLDLWPDYPKPHPKETEHAS